MSKEKVEELKGKLKDRSMTYSQRAAVYKSIAQIYQDSLKDKRNASANYANAARALFSAWGEVENTERPKMYGEVIALYEKAGVKPIDPRSYWGTLFPFTTDRTRMGEAISSKKYAEDSLKYKAERARAKEDGGLEEEADDAGSISPRKNNSGAEVTQGIARALVTRNPGFLRIGVFLVAFSFVYFFLNNSITANAISNLSDSTFTFTGTVVFLVAIILAFFYFKRNSKPSLMGAVDRKSVRKRKK